MILGSLTANRDGSCFQLSVVSLRGRMLAAREWFIAKRPYRQASVGAP